MASPSNPRYSRKNTFARYLLRRPLSIALLVLVAFVLGALTFNSKARASAERQESPRLRSAMGSKENLTIIHNHSGGEEAHSTSTGDEPDPDVWIVQMENGEISCREPTPEEIPIYTRDPDVEGGIQINHLLVQTEQARVDAGENAETGLRIILVALSQLQASPDRALVEAAFMRAAAVWESRIKSPVDIVINIDYGPNVAGTTTPFEPGVLGSASSRRAEVDYPGARTNLIAGASTVQENALYNSLPTSFIPTDVGNVSVVSFNRSVAFAVGIPVPAIQNPDQREVATIGFNSAFSFDLDRSNGISPGQHDFEGVAIHEIGHALGFTSRNGAGSTFAITSWDIFRFRPGVTEATFATANRIQEIGGDQVFFLNQNFNPAQPVGSAMELGLSTGGPTPAPGCAGGRQSSHWKDDSCSGGFYIGVMDPTLPSGTVQNTTENDFIALEAIGWNLVSTQAAPPPPPPPPPPANDNFANAQTINGCSGSVNGTTLGATRETGEPSHDPGGSPGGGSVWYQWQAPSTGSVTINTTGSATNFDTVLAVYTGTSISALTVIAKNDDIELGVIRTSSVTFNATAGTAYKIAVDGWNGERGNFVLNWTQNNCTDVAPVLLTEEGTNRAVALDSVTQVRDPFPIIGLFNFSADQRTRVMLFTSDLGLGPGDNLSVLSVQVHGISLPIESAGPVPGLSQVSYIIVRLTEQLPSGDLSVTVTLRGVSSNTATIRVEQ